MILVYFDILATIGCLFLAGMLIRCYKKMQILKREIQKQHDMERANQHFPVRYLSNLSHELRSPLHNIVTATEMGDEGLLGELTHKQSEIMHLIQENAHHLLSIINDILDISRIEAGKYILLIENINPSQLVQEVIPLIEPMINQKKQTLVVNISNNLPPYFQGDPLRLKQALVNLLSNAQKYSSDGTTITLDLSLNEKEKELCIAIQDEGPGLPESVQSFILKPFERLVDSGSTESVIGSGLGLSITQKIIEQHEGRLEIHSIPGVGSRFMILLPFTSSVTPNNSQELAIEQDVLKVI